MKYYCILLIIGIVYQNAIYANTVQYCTCICFHTVLQVYRMNACEPVIRHKVLRFIWMHWMSEWMTDWLWMTVCLSQWIAWRIEWCHELLPNIGSHWMHCLQAINGFVHWFCAPIIDSIDSCLCLNTKTQTNDSMI